MQPAVEWLTSSVAGVIRVVRAHVLDAAEKDHILRLISNHITLLSNHHVTHCNVNVAEAVEDLSASETLD